MVRPPKWSDEQRVHAVGRILAGEGIASVARDMGIPEATLRLWRGTIAPELGAAAERVTAVSAGRVISAGRVTAGAVTAAPTSLAERAPGIADAVLEEIGYIGFGNLSDVVSWDDRGSLRFTPSCDLTPAQAAIVSEVRVKRRREIHGRGDDTATWEVEEASIKVRDKLGALRELARITGLVQDGTSVSVAVDARQQSLTVLDGLSTDELRGFVAALGDGDEQQAIQISRDRMAGLKPDDARG